MSIAEEAYAQLYPDKDHNYVFSVKYSGKFKSYNANVRRRGNSITFNLSREWKAISKDIKIGLMQELFVKLFREEKKAAESSKTNKKTIEMELYNIFIKNVHLAIPKTITDPILEEAFSRLNEHFFHGMMEQPNLAWGNASVRKLGSYEYGSDMITISSIFKGENPALITLMEYVLYHEMLHKKLKFDCRNGRSHSHTHEFKRLEALFPDSKGMEKKISGLVRGILFHKHI